MRTLAVLEQGSRAIWARISDRRLTRSCCCHCQNPGEESQACQSSDAQLHGYCVRCSWGSLQKLTVWSGSWRRLISSDQSSRFYTIKRGTGPNWPDELPLRAFYSVCVCIRVGDRMYLGDTVVCHFLFCDIIMTLTKKFTETEAQVQPFLRPLKDSLLLLFLLLYLTLLVTSNGV